MVRKSCRFRNRDLDWLHSPQLGTHCGVDDRTGIKCRNPTCHQVAKPISPPQCSGYFRSPLGRRVPSRNASIPSWSMASRHSILESAINSKLEGERTVCGVTNLSCPCTSITECRTRICPLMIQPEGARSARSSCFVRQDRHDQCIVGWLPPAGRIHSGGQAPKSPQRGRGCGDSLSDRPDLPRRGQGTGAAVRSRRLT